MGPDEKSAGTYALYINGVKVFDHITKIELDVNPEAHDDPNLPSSFSGSFTITLTKRESRRFKRIFRKAFRKAKFQLYRTRWKLIWKRQANLLKLRWLEWLQDLKS